MLDTPSSQYCCSVVRMVLLVCSHMKEQSALNSETMDQYSHTLLTLEQEQVEQPMQLLGSANNIVIQTLILHVSKQYTLAFLLQYKSRNTELRIIPDTIIVTKPVCDALL